jgi:hypothetical protein
MHTARRRASYTLIRSRFEPADLSESVKAGHLNADKVSASGAGARGKARPFNLELPSPKTPRAVAPDTAFSDEVVRAGFVFVSSDGGIKNF